MSSIAPPAFNRLFKAVFISETRINTLRKRVSQKLDPTYIAYGLIEKQAQGLTNYHPQAPSVWHAPAFAEDPQSYSSVHIPLREDACSAYTLALYYRTKKKSEFAQAAGNILHAWSSKLQVLRQNQASRLLFCQHFPTLIFASDLLKNSPFWPRSAQNNFKTFLAQRAIEMDASDQPDLLGVWGLYLTMSIALCLNDHVAFEKACDRWKELLNSLWQKNGVLREKITPFKLITSPLYLQHLVLTPMTLIAEMARVNGIDLFTYLGKEVHLKQLFEQTVFQTRNTLTGDEPRNIRKYAFEKDIFYFEILNAKWPNATCAELLRWYRPISSPYIPHLTFTHGNLAQDDYIQRKGSDSSLSLF